MFGHPSGPPTISGVTLSNGLGFTVPATAGSTIDTLTATCSAGSCAGATFGPLATTGACSGATSNGSFAISGSNLNIGGTTISTAGSYPIGIPVTLAGATNSGTCYPQTLVGSTGGAGASWDPSTTTGHDPSISLSNTTTTNDTATGTINGNAFKSARATLPSYAVGTSHKVVAAFSIVTASSNVGAANDGLGTLVGVFGGSNSLANHMASAAPSFAIEGGTGGDFQNNVNNGATGACGAFTGGLNYKSGDTVWIAIDFNSGSGKVWCSKTCTTWVGGGTPAAGTFPSATLTSGTYFLGWSGANFNSSPQSGPDKVKLNAAPSLGSCTGLDASWHTWNAG